MGRPSQLSSEMPNDLYWRFRDEGTVWVQEEQGTLSVNALGSLCPARRDAGFFVGKLESEGLVENLLLGDADCVLEEVSREVPFGQVPFRQVTQDLREGQKRGELECHREERRAHSHEKAREARLVPV